MKAISNNDKYEEIIHDNTTFNDNDKFNRYLLFKYLTKHYGEDNARKLILKHQDNLFNEGGLAVALGEKDFEYFCLYFLQDTFIPKHDNTARKLAQTHYEIWQEMQKMFIDDKFDKEIFILSRGMAKTTVLNKAVSCFLHCYKKSIYSIVIGNKQSDAEQFISDTRQMLENKFIVRGFGNLIDKSDTNRTLNKQEVELTNDTKIQAFSWGSSVRGTTYKSNRPSLILLDDVLSEDNVLSDQAKEKALTKFYKEIAETGDSEVIRNGVRVKSATKFLVLGTPLAQGDLIATISKDSTFKVFHRKVVDFDIDEYFENNKHWQHYKSILMNDKIEKEDKDIILNDYYLNNYKDMKFKTIWSKYTCDSLAQKYFTQRSAFTQELMCDVTNIGVKWIKSIRLQSTQEIENNEFIKTMLCVDPATSTKSTADYSAFTVGSMSNNGFKYIRKGIVDKLSFNDYCNKVVELLLEYDDITHVYIEKNTFNGSDLIKIEELISENEILKNKHFEFINEMQRKNKDSKIASITDDINGGRVIFNEEDTQFIEQVQEFSGQHYSANDDAIDSVAECVLRLNSIKNVNKVKLLDRKLFGF